MRPLPPLLCIALLAGSLPDAAQARGRFLSALLARGTAQGVAHATASVASPAPVKTYGPDVLSVEALADCISRADKLDKDIAFVESERALVNARFDQVDRSKADIDRAEDALNRKSQAAVDRFNASVRRHNTMLADAKASQATFNQRVSSHNGDVETYNTACAKKYYADDLEAAKRIVGVE